MKKKAIHIFPLFILGILLFQSCNSTKYLEGNEYLLNSYKIEDTGDDLHKEECKNYIKQKPNKKIIGWKFWLDLYNISAKEPKNGIGRWFKKVGEPPVIYSEDLTDNTSTQLILFLNNKGYFNASVTDTTYFRKNKARVVYQLDPGKPYTIGNIDYFFEDASLSKFLMTDSLPSILKTGDNFDVDVLQKERDRIESVLRNNGYYNFSKEYIYFEIDSALGNNRVSILQGIKNFSVLDARGRVIDTRHPKYTVRNVYMKTSSGLPGAMVQEGVNELDTLIYDDVYVLSNSTTKIKPELITQKNFIIPDKFYNKKKVLRTYRNLTSLSAFRMVDINFTEVKGVQNQLDCEIQMMPAVTQAFTGAIEGTTSGGNIGVAGNLNYQHRNLFSGSEKFDLTFLGALETLAENPENPGQELGTMQELGVEAKLEVPQFLLPLSTEGFIRKYNPQTSFNLSYNFQRRPDYTRTTFKSGVRYRWRGNRNLMHTLYPIEVSLINTPYLSTSFEEWLSKTYLYYSYQPHFITDIRYNAVFSSQKINKDVDFNYVRFGVETAGNMMYGAYHLIGNPENDAVLKLFGVNYAQYARTEIDYRHYDYLDEGISLVYRGYVGAAIPYLNSNAIPFEKQFFGGGANSIRAWRVKNLGPGSFTGDTISKYPNQTADLKLEANIEYRFKLFWKLEGAFFVDVGNIWSLSSEDDREGALFDIKKFYKELAVGTGAGARVDLDFFIFRFDVGIPLVDPSNPEGKRWLPYNGGIPWSELGYNIAIGYPF